MNATLHGLGFCYTFTASRAGIQMHVHALPLGIGESLVDISTQFFIVEMPVHDANSSSKYARLLGESNVRKWL
jgi:hypothetical protein